MGKIINLIGEKYGRLTVLSLAEKPQGSKSTSKFWLCECECGNKKIISGNVLRQGKSKSCGCLNNEMRPTEDLSNKKFGHLTVVTRVPKPEHLKSKGAYWLCKCDCGKEKIVMGKTLRNGEAHSCGACRVDIVDDLTGQIFDNLTVIERDFSRPSNNNGAFWKCRCTCGNTITVLGKNLKHQKYHSCGCIRSKGEQLLQKLLEENNINFQKEYIFNDLTGLKGGSLRFDFAIFIDGKLDRLIEFQGEQHYTNNEFLNWGEYTIQHDKIKKHYCLKNNIPLICIPYWKRDTLKIEDILTNHYLVTEVEE